MDTSGAGVGTAPPPLHGVKVPPASTWPSLPVVRLTPRTYRWTASGRPVLLVTVMGSRLPAGGGFGLSAGGGGAVVAAGFVGAGAVVGVTGGLGAYVGAYVV